MRLLRIGGVLTLLGLGALVTTLVRLEKHNPIATTQEGHS
jgi:hypothetical protein